jgi:predicted transcriptional regulator
MELLIIQSMRKNIRALQDIVSRKGSSKVLTFSIPHVFKALQLLNEEKFVSRATFGKEIHLGEGAVKTLILHLKEAGMINTTKSGTFLTEKGHKIINQIQSVVSKECKIKKCSILQGKHNHAVLLKNYSSIVKTGLEQRDYAILYGSSGCTTMICKNKKLVFPGDEKKCFVKDIKTENHLLENLCPNEGDVIIISSSNDPFVAEISAKNSALWTMASV